MDISEIDREKYLSDSISKNTKNINEELNSCYECLNKMKIDFNQKRINELKDCLENIKYFSDDILYDSWELHAMIDDKPKSFFQDIADDMKEMMNYVKNAPEYLMNKWKNTIEKFSTKGSKSKELEKEVVRKKPKAKLVSRPKADNSNTFHR